MESQGEFEDVWLQSGMVAYSFAQGGTDKGIKFLAPHSFHENTRKKSWGLLREKMATGGHKMTAYVPPPETHFCGAPNMCKDHSLMAGNVRGEGHWQVHVSGGRKKRGNPSLGKAALKWSFLFMQMSCRRKVVPHSSTRSCMQRTLLPHQLRAVHGAECWGRRSDVLVKHKSLQV